MKAKTVKEVLIAVEWMLVNVGWGQGEYYTDKSGRMLATPDARTRPDQIGSMCLQGAFELVEKDDSVGLMDAERFWEKANDLNCHITVFNDSRHTTKSMVLRTLRKAIEKA